MGIGDLMHCKGVPPTVASAGSDVLPNIAYKQLLQNKLKVAVGIYHFYKCRLEERILFFLFLETGFLIALY